MNCVYRCPSRAKQLKIAPEKRGGRGRGCCWCNSKNPDGVRMMMMMLKQANLRNRSECVKMSIIWKNCVGFFHFRNVGNRRNCKKKSDLWKAREKNRSKKNNEQCATSKKSRESEFQTVSTKNLCGGVRVCVCQTKSLSRSSRRADLSEEPRTVPGIPSHHRRHEFKQKCVCMIGVVDLRYCLKSLFLRVMAPSPWFEVVPESRTTGDLSENVVVHLSLVWFTTILESYNKIITHKKKKTNGQRQSARKADNNDTESVLLQLLRRIDL